MDLRGASVFMDFDGTVTTYDTGLYLLERLATDGWRDVEAQYLAGEIGSRDCIASQWAMLPRDRQLIEAVTSEVAIDPAFSALTAHLRSLGAEVTILSDGFGFRAEEVAAKAGLPVVTNAIDWDAFKVLFPNSDASCPCARCGTCKQAPIRAARRLGRTTVLIGDGRSDAKAAELADVVFAKDGLARWCERAGIAHCAFTDFTDLLAQLRGGATRSGVL